MIIKGLAASPGIVIGRVFLLEEEKFDIQKREIKPDEVKGEIARFKKALAVTKEEMNHTRQRVMKQLGKKHSRLFDAYLLILSDSMLRDDTTKIISENHTNAEYALQIIIDRITKTFNMIDDEYLRERGRDILDVGMKILKNLLGQERRTLANIKSQVVVIARSLTPSDTIAMREENVIGFATDIGGRTSHTAIMAKSLEIPAVVGLKNVTRAVRPGDTLIVDGNQGLVIVNPDKLTIESYEREKKKYIQIEKELEKLKDLQAVTMDGHSIELTANIEVPEEITSVLAHGGSGIGLYRTEYLYLDRKDLPSEEEQFQKYKEVAEKILPYSVVVRTLDLGADKFPEDLGFSTERNPFMGMRAIRLCLKNPWVFKTQLRAILRASLSGNLKIMYPMVSCIDEIRKANIILDDVKDELRHEGVPFNEDIEVGVMIEVPSAALTADYIAQEVDFLSIGTNDLIQYTLAVDRVNENVSSLYDPLHISILRLIRNIIDAGHKYGKWVSMCGEMAGDPNLTRILLGLQLDELSMSSINIPRAKKIIRSSNYTECRKVYNDILEAEDTKEIENILRRDQKLMEEQI